MRRCTSGDTGAYPGKPIGKLVDKCNMVRAIMRASFRACQGSHLVLGHLLGLDQQRDELDALDSHRLALVVHQLRKARLEACREAVQRRQVLRRVVGVQECGEGRLAHQSILHKKLTAQSEHAARKRGDTIKINLAGHNNDLCMVRLHICAAQHYSDKVHAGFTVLAVGHLYVEASLRARAQHRCSKDQKQDKGSWNPT